MPGAGNPQALNRYAYTLGNPVRYTDPSGHWVDTVLDIAGIVWDLHDIHKNGLNWSNGLALAVDVVCAVVPLATGGGALVRAASHADEAVDVVRAVNRVDDVTDAARVVERVDDIGDTLRAADRAGVVEVGTIVYRGGSGTPRNLTPRPGIDTTGLSTFDTLEAATRPGEKAQIIDTALLKPPLQAIPDSPPGHISIRPTDSALAANPHLIDEWAATRGSATLHPFTQNVLDAIIGVTRRPK